MGEPAMRRAAYDNHVRECHDDWVRSDERLGYPAMMSEEQVTRILDWWVESEARGVPVIKHTLALTCDWPRPDFGPLFG